MHGFVVMYTYIIPSIRQYCEVPTSGADPAPPPLQWPLRAAEAAPAREEVSVDD